MTEKSRQKVKYIEKEKSFQDEIKSISRPFERVFILAKIKKKTTESTRFLEGESLTFKIKCSDTVLLS